MIGRAVGSAPWLRRDQARALLAARLRTFLNPAAGVSPELCRHLADLLNADTVPAIPARGSGAAGEIIPLAHAGAALIGAGQFLDAGQAGPAPRSFGPKEGIAFLEGVPGLTGLAVLGSAAARVLIDQVVVGAAASHTVIRASLDPLQPALADSDELRAVLESLRDLRGQAEPGALQAPVSFRVTAPALAVAMRAVAGVEAAVDRALNAVTDSPAHLDGEFVGTFGFAGTDLTASLGALTTALVHLAEVGAARLHRLLDPRVTGLAPQLSHSPGLHAGMAAVHKRAAGVTHRLRRFAISNPFPTTLSGIGARNRRSDTSKACGKNWRQSSPTPAPTGYGMTWQKAAAPPATKNTSSSFPSKIGRFKSSESSMAQWTSAVT